jgi:hypothetical protein
LSFEPYVCQLLGTNQMITLNLVNPSIEYVNTIAYLNQPITESICHSNRDYDWTIINYHYGKTSP